MRRNVLFGSCLALALGTAGCQDTSEPMAPSSGPNAAFSLNTTPGDFGLDRGSLKLPATVRMSDPFIAEAAQRAINEDDYVCTSSTPVLDWFVAARDTVDEQEPEIFDLAFNQLLADVIPTFDALFFQTTATPQFFGYNGEYTSIVQKTERKVKDFWDISSADIQVIGMHGTMLLDVERSAATYAFLFGLDPATATFFAGLVRDALLQSQLLDGGNHPLFSFNAFAASFVGGALPDKIIMGDGILAGYEAVGLDDVAPQGIFAHEFAHHIQFANGYFDDPIATSGDAAEQTRYTELMADAMSAYFLTHKRGLAMNRKRVEEFFQVFFQIGDCAFSNPGHHGTPNQRMAAARLGFDLAFAAQKQGQILTSDQVYQHFVAAYPTLIAPDAP